MDIYKQRALTAQLPPKWYGELYCAHKCPWRHDKGCFIYGTCGTGEIKEEYPNCPDHKKWPSTLRHPDCITMHGHLIKGLIKPHKSKKQAEIDELIAMYDMVHGSYKSAVEVYFYQKSFWRLW